MAAVTDEIDPALRERLAAIVDDVLSRPVDYEKLAAEEAARTDPWRWYCRLCGTAGAVDHGPGARERRDEAAEKHLRETPCGRHAIPGRAESGRLLHVWSYPDPRSVAAPYN